MSQDFFDLAREELRKAQTRYPPMNSLHEAYAVILEEVEELWAEAKAWKGSLTEERALRVGKECLHIAAMAGRCVEDLL